MKQLLAIALNDLKIEFKDKSTWLSFLVLPLVFTAVIGLATGGNRDPNIDRRYPVAVTNLDSGPLAAQLVVALKESPVVRIIELDSATATAQLENEEVQATLTLPADFTAMLLAGQPHTLALNFRAENTDNLAIREALQTATAQVSRTVLAALISVEEAEKLRPFADAAERAAYLAAALQLAEAEASQAPVEVVTQQSALALTNRIPQGFTQSSPGQLVTWVLGTLLGGAGMLVGERTLGTLRRLLTMPAPRWALLGGKILGRFLLGLLQMLVMIVSGLVLFQVQWGNSPLALLLVAVCFGLAATALGLFIATIARTEGQANGYASMATFILAPLGGAWFPIEITPPFFRAFSQLFPTHWAMRGFTDVIARGQGPEGVLLECGVLLLFAAGFFALGIWRFKYE